MGGGEMGVTAWTDLLSLRPRAFVNEFKPDENVRLFMRTTPDRALDTVVKEITGTNDKRIATLDQQQDHRWSG